MKTPFTLTVTAKKNGTFDHLVTDEAGKLVGTRNSKKHYRFATVVRRNVEDELKYAAKLVEYQRINPTHYNKEYVDGKLARVSAMKAEGEQYAWGVYSFNSKATPLAARLRSVYDGGEVVTEAATVREFSATIPAIGHPAAYYVFPADNEKQARQKAHSLFLAQHSIAPGAIHLAEVAS